MNGNPDSWADGLSKTFRRKPPWGFVSLEQLATLGFIVMFVALAFALLMPATRQSRPAARLSHCRNNLKQIGLALHNYADEWGAFPPAYTVDAEGNPLHSWRTLILPYLDQGPLYATIDLSKPWNDPANAEAYNATIYPYRCPSIDLPNTDTTYLAVVAAGSCLRPGRPRPFSEITGQFGETLLVIEATPENAVHWMSPLDADQSQVLAFGPKTVLAHSGGVTALFADGSVRLIAAEAPPAERRNWISISGNGN